MFSALWFEGLHVAQEKRRCSLCKFQTVASTDEYLSTQMTVLRCVCAIDVSHPTHPTESTDVCLLCFLPPQLIHISAQTVSVWFSLHVECPLWYELMTPSCLVSVEFIPPCYISSDCDYARGFVVAQAISLFVCLMGSSAEEANYFHRGKSGVDLWLWIYSEWPFTH